MTFVQPEYFTEAARQKSFTKAAEVLYLSQPALSKSIKALEEEYGCQLFNRNGKRLELTEIGKVFYEHATRILDTYNRQVSALQEEMNLAKSNLRLGIPPTAGAMGFFELIASFKENYPHVDVQIEEYTSVVILQKIMQDLLDFGVIINPYQNERLHSIPLCLSEAVCIVNKDHPLAKEEAISFVQLKDEPFLSISKDYMFYEITARKFWEAGIEPNIVFSSYYWEGLYEMAASGLGVTILPLPLVSRFHQSRVKELHLKDPEFPYSLWIVYKKGKSLTNTMKEFVGLCKSRQPNAR